MGLFSSSKSKTTNVSNTSVRNDAISGNQGPVYSDLSGVTFQSLDGGAVEDALKFGSGALDGAVDLAGRSLDTVDYSVGRIANTANESRRDALDFGANSLSFVDTGLDSLLDFGGEIIDSQQRQLTNTLASINAANASTAQLDSVNSVRTAQEIGGTVKKVAMYAALAVAAYAAFRKFGAK